MGAFADGVDWLLEQSVVGSFTKVGGAVRSHLDDWGPLPEVAGRTIVLTGATSGLGAAAARQLAACGATLRLVGRSKTKLDETARYLAPRARGGVTTHVAELSSLHETVAAAEEIAALGPVDVVACNAGALLPSWTASPEGIETTVAVHLYSPIAMVDRLRPLLDASPCGRVIVMTSGGMYTERFDAAKLEMRPDRYRGTVAYARAKRAQTLWVEAETAAQTAIDFHLVHPGWAATPGVDASLPGLATLTRPLLRSPEAGALDLCWLATAPADRPAPGQLWLDRRARPLHRMNKTRLGDAEPAAAAELLASARARIAEVLGQS